MCSVQPSPALITCHLFNYSNARVVVAGRLAKWLNYSKLQGKDSPVVLLDAATTAADCDNPCQHSQWFNHQYLRISNRINNTVLQRVIDWHDSWNTYDRMWTILLHSFDFINFSRLFIWVSLLLLLLLFYQSRARAFYLLVGTAALTQTQQSSWLTWTRTPSELPTHSPCWLLVHYFHMFVRSSIAPKPSQAKPVVVVVLAARH